MCSELDQVHKHAFLSRWESGQDEEAMEVKEGAGGVVGEEGFDSRKLGPLWLHNEVGCDFEFK